MFVVSIFNAPDIKKASGIVPFGKCGTLAKLPCNVIGGNVVGSLFPNCAGVNVT